MVWLRTVPITQDKWQISHEEGECNLVEDGKTTFFNPTIPTIWSLLWALPLPPNTVTVTPEDRAIFVWPWNENVQTKQKQQMNRNRAIWLVYQMDTNVRVFWLVKQMPGWKNFMPKNSLDINQYFALMSYCNMIGQSNNPFSISGNSLAGKRRSYVWIFSSIGW